MANCPGACNSVPPPRLTQRTASRRLHSSAGAIAQVGPRAFTANRDDRRVFANEQRNLPVGAARDFVHQPPLEREARIEVDDAQQVARQLPARFCDC